MSLTGIFRKTDKGSEEVKSRAHGLPNRMRPLLILVDGRLAADELLRRAPDPAAAGEQLQALLDGGFIEAVGGGAAATAATIADLPTTRRRVVKALYDNLGPAADDFALRVEKATTAEDLHAATEWALKGVEAMRGARGAEKVRAAIQSG